MSKLVGWQGGYPVQAAAGTDTVKTWATPTVGAAMLGAVVGGWFLGRVVGESIIEGKTVFEAEDIAPDYLPTDFQEWLATVGAAAAMPLTWSTMEQLADKFGWKTLGWYAVGLGVITAWRKYA